MVLAASVGSREAGAEPLPRSRPGTREALMSPRAQEGGHEDIFDARITLVPTHPSPRHQAPLVGRAEAHIRETGHKTQSPPRRRSRLVRGHRDRHIHCSPQAHGDSKHRKAGREWLQGRAQGTVTAEGDSRQGPARDGGTALQTMPREKSRARASETQHSPPSATS